MTEQTDQLADALHVDAGSMETASELLRDHAARLDQYAGVVRQLGQPPAPTLAPVGMCLGGGRNPSAAEAPKLAEQLLALGITHLRMTLLWSAVEPNGDGNVKVPASFVSVCQAIEQAGVRVLVMFGGTPPRYRDPVRSQDLWAPPAAGMISRYGLALREVQRQLPMVTRWEVWNEPNGYFLNPVPPSAARQVEVYAGLVVAAANNAPRSVELVAGVVCPSKRITPPAFIEQWYQQDGRAGDRFDRLSVHAYAGTARLGESVWATGHLPAIRSTIGAGVTIDNTECGYSTGGSSALTEQQQAALLVDAIEWWRQQPYAGVFYIFNWRELATDDPRSNGLGIHKADGTPKRAVAAIRELLT